MVARTTAALPRHSSRSTGPCAARTLALVLLLVLALPPHHNLCAHGLDTSWRGAGGGRSAGGGGGEHAPGQQEQQLVLRVQPPPPRAQAELQRNRNLNMLIVVPEHKLIFCSMPKVSSQSFNNLFRSLRARYDPAQAEGGIFWRNTFTQHNMTLEQLTDAMNDPSWHKALFYREPLERFVSAFRSKCEPGHDTAVGLCQEVFGAEEPTFERAVKRLGEEPAVINSHWRAQVDLCGGLPDTLHLYQTVERLDRGRSREQVASLLQSVGVEPETVPAFNKYFPERTAELYARIGEHGTMAGETAPDYYATPQLVCQVVSFYLNDYLTLGIPLPEWVLRRWGDAHVGSWLHGNCGDLPP